MSIESVMLSSHFILCRPLLLLLSLFPSIRIFLVSQLFASGRWNGLVAYMGCSFKRFFWMWISFKVFIEFVIIFVLFCFVLFFPVGHTGDASLGHFISPSRDWTYTPSIRRWNLNHWTAREVTAHVFIKERRPDYEGKWMSAGGNRKEKIQSPKEIKKNLWFSFSSFQLNSL